MFREKYVLLLLEMSVLIYSNLYTYSRMIISSLDFTQTRRHAAKFVVANFRVTGRGTILFEFSMQFILVRSYRSVKAGYHRAKHYHKEHTQTQ